VDSSGKRFGTIIIFSNAVVHLSVICLSNARGFERKRGSQIQRFWTCQRLYLGNGARQEVS